MRVPSNQFICNRFSNIFNIKGLLGIFFGHSRVKADARAKEEAPSKKPKVVEVVAEEVPVEINREGIIYDIQDAKRMKDLTDVFFANKEYIEKDEHLMKLMKAKKESLTTKKK